MRILILGGGARENVICEKLKTNNNVFVLNVSDNNKIIQFCINNFIDLVIPSTEDFLCQGIVNEFNQLLPSVKVFGPDKYQSQIEGSKYFSKSLMDSLNIPTAPYIYCSNMKSVYRGNPNYDPIIFDNIPVLKYSGLAKGKGVYLPNSRSAIPLILPELFNLGNDGVIIEKRLFGTEVSLLAFCNGKEATLMPQAQDYKRVYDGDQGPNTGGMGAICPANVLTENEIAIAKSHMDKIVKHLNYKGILYAGLMKTKDNVYFLEFNCRFGDPEAQVLISLLNSDLYKIMIDCINGKEPIINWTNNYSVCLVLSHKGYPHSRSNEELLIELLPLGVNIIVWGTIILYSRHKHKQRMKAIEEEWAERRRRWELEDSDRMTELNRIRREMENEWPFNIHTDKLSPKKKMGAHKMR